MHELESGAEEKRSAYLYRVVAVYSGARMLAIGAAAGGVTYLIGKLPGVTLG